MASLRRALDKRLKELEEIHGEMSSGKRLLPVIVDFLHYNVVNTALWEKKGLSLDLAGHIMSRALGFSSRFLCCKFSMVSIVTGKGLSQELISYWRITEC
ncbi:hypothetical protein BT93_C1443 [Corymbia citriodora subsp. variegata]|uniref:Uncharacterized protein n=1 Tax=Corymbia citriodora subsp. variegata TaxID=360336 RepID=A0A8T0CVR2_CORYI|nr:hypothetical protein BT93_L3218 [Corymbia citriodora subsp. variegata]KAF8035412.1 hypothetical protein BT93_C1443 [Corymbia citriodora subsp. variegata]